MSFTRTNGAPRKQYEAGEPIVEESHAATLDINYIVDKFTRTGVLDHNQQYGGQYGNFIAGDIYEIAQDAIAQANGIYESLPGAIRQQFPHGTAQFLDFINDPENAEEIEALGLTTDHLDLPEPISDPTPTDPTAPVENPTEAVTEALTTPQA